MADTSRVVGELVRRAVEMNVRYYGSLLGLATDYVRDLGGIVTGSLAGASAPARPAARPAGGARPPPVMVLEAEAGEEARGLFVLHNVREREVKARVTASEARDPGGGVVQADLRFEPPEVALAPGQQTTVLAVARLDERMEPGVPYTASFGVPGLAENAVSAVLRRRHPLAAPGTAQEGGAAAAAEPVPGSERKEKSTRKKAKKRTAAKKKPRT